MYVFAITFVIFTRMSLVNMFLLLLASFVVLTLGTCIDRKCPLGQFYNATTDHCVNSCYPNYGNWSTGRCTQGNFLFLMLNRMAGLYICNLVFLRYHHLCIT